MTQHPSADHSDIPLFQSILESEVGVRFDLVDEINDRIGQTQSTPLTREDLLKTVKTIDEVLAQYAHDHRYSVDETRDEVVDELAQWARVRTMIAQELLPILQEDESSAPKNDRMRA